MLRIFLFILLIFSAANAKMQDVELLANSIDKNGKLIIAKGDVLVYSQLYLMTADKALYNDTTEELELFGNVNIIRGISESVKSDYAKLNLKNNIGSFKPFFTYNDKKDMWIECENAESKDKFYITNNSITSSCNVQDPDWKIGFSTGKLDKKSRFLQLHNVIFYIRDTPIFYLPYFAISTDTTRRTGLLIPSLGYGTKDGIYYKQPIYVAEYDWWDLQFNPQIRTNRGYGLYTTFRFKDGKTSGGSVTVGGFKDKSSYNTKENLKNNLHKGYEVKYKNNDILEKYLKDDVDDGVWLDFIYLNDIDYLNLQNNKREGYGSLVTSRMNYFIRDESDYLGVYAKYYIDTEKVNNDGTLQELPTVQYHRFLDSIIFPNLLYSFDLQFHNYTRDTGITARQIEANLPITFYTTFFDDFLHVSASENISATYVKYGNKQVNTSDTLIRNYHIFSAYTDLAKAYPWFYHTMKFGVDYVIPSVDRGNIEADFITTQSETENIKLGLVQFLYDTNGNKKLKHSIKQVFYQDDNLYKYGDLENFISYYFSKDIYVKNELKYSYKNRRFSKFQTTLHVDYKNYSGDLMHTYQYGLHGKKENFLIASAQAKYADNFTVFANTNYNVRDGYAQSWKAGVRRDRKCWNFTLYYREDISPKLTSAGSDYVKKNGFYISFELYPLGGTDYDFAKETSVNNR